ncbi:N-6 DNA methylase [Candidatus Poriferisocius sp.]|uniref:N-6 DNA methylase n=1 Tax=Candidatus Poriferisocius sp. TaxID=3101276 RepID=UPI003B024105
MVLDGHVSLSELVERLANRSRRGRTEATVQADVRMLLLAAGLNLTEGDVLDVELEAPLADRRRIDVEMGRTVIEVKRSLAPQGALGEAATQLAGYVEMRSRSLAQQYVGIVTDGRDWHLFHHTDGLLVEVAEHHVDAAAPNVEALVTWLSSVLTTEERVIPTRQALADRIGAASPGHDLERAALRALYDAHRSHPEIAIKRELWAKLLTTALGTQFSADEEDLFIEHTLLVATAECVAHAVLGYSISQLPPGDLLRGDLLSQGSQIHGVVEQDFFDWPLDCGGEGRRWVSSLARRLEQFDWGAVTHDVMKTIYESVITVETRRRLGEYYTPDFLAEAITEQVVADPLAETVMDPACGSGTFLFHAVRRYLEAADKAGMSNGDAVAGVSSHVFGVDVHPVAVTLARVTYLLAIGAERLSAPDRRELRVPVFLGDSVQWGQRSDIFASETLNVSTDDGAEMFADQLRFPQRLLDDADTFDALVAEMADSATNRERGKDAPSFAGIARRHGLSGDDRDTVEATFKTMCRLHDERRDHIWGYYVRNLARPAWLSRKENRRTVLVGNPPWLAYRYMTDAMKAVFQLMAKERKLWAGGNVATHQDLADLFVARSVERYLAPGGRFAFVMPAGVLSRGQSAGFRSGVFPLISGGSTDVVFDPAWDISPISHRFFPRTACVVFGMRSDRHSSLPEQVERWSGNLSDPGAPWDEVQGAIEREVGERVSLDAAEQVESPYKERFANGANLYPRMLVIVDPDKEPPLGAGEGRRPVRSSRGIYENPPWKWMDDLEGVIESQFIHQVLLGESVMPYWQRSPFEAILPLRKGKIMRDEEIDDHHGLKRWWHEARPLWDEHGEGEHSLDENIDHYEKLTSQFPLAPIRVVYGASGMHVTACRVVDRHAIVEHQLNWAAVRSTEEAQYLCAILNSVTVTKAAEPYMTSGKGGGRHISHLWRVPMPLYDDHNDLHTRLADLGSRAEQFVAGLEIKPSKAHGHMRRKVREQLAVSEVGQEIEGAVGTLLDQAGALSW